MLHDLTPPWALKRDCIRYFVRVNQFHKRQEKTVPKGALRRSNSGEEEKAFPVRLKNMTPVL